MKTNNPNDRPHRVLIIGIDAATMDLVRPWAEAGRLPNFASLLREGASGALRSVPSRNSAAGWTSLMTGKNPGKHGIFFFTGYDEGSLDYQYLNASHRDGASLWKLLGDAGLKVGVINVPMTFPAEEVNGFLIAGMDAPSVDVPGFCYPENLAEELSANLGEYVIEPGIGSSIRAGEFDDAVRDLRLMTEGRLASARYLMMSRPWDFFMVTFRAPDPAQHHFWRFMEPQRFDVTPREVERYGSVISEVYAQIDAAVGELIELAGKGTTVMIVSDHGACANTAKPSALLRWLEAMGMLRFRRAVSGSPVEQLRRLGWKGLASMYRQADKRFSRRLKVKLSQRFPGLRARTETRNTYSRIDWSGTKAFTDGKRPEIWINVRGRWRYGTVEPGEEYRHVCATIKEKLLSARAPGTDRPLVKHVHHRDEVYHGKYVERSGDLIVEWHPDAVTSWVDFGDGVIVGPGTGSSDNLRELSLSGAHDLMGLLFMQGGPVRPGVRVEGATLLDIAPTVLYLMGQPVPDDMDGRVLTEALDVDHVAAPRPGTTSEHRKESAESSTKGYSEEDEEIIGDRLRGLGYIE